MTTDNPDQRYRVEVTRRVFPKTPVQGPVLSKLSIIDATVGRFAPAAAIWLYDKSEQAQLPYHELFETIALALSENLSDYPHFAGQIQWATKDMVENDPVPRHLGRPVVVHGIPTDPGVELIIAKYDQNLEDVVPSRADRADRLKVWNATDFRQTDFLPDTKIALSSLNQLEGLPSMAVQLTAFNCGGIGVSATISHPLADATCLMNFMRSWAARSRVLLKSDRASSDGEIVKPVFDPSLLDRVADLVHGEPPNAAKVDKARSLPMHRYDWWAENAPGFPAWSKTATQATMPTEEELKDIKLSPSEFPPWPTWDLGAVVEHVQIRFSSDELGRMKEAAQQSLPEDLCSHNVSRLDSILAHVWILMNRTRDLPTEEHVYMDLTLGIRHRVDPPLPENFAGSPLLLAYVEKTAGEAASAPLGHVAGEIRRNMSLFTPDAVAAYIHDAAHEVSPQRLWQAFLGSHHALVTSWVRAKTYELDFLGTQELARYVQGVMPKLDGLVQVMDVADTGDFDVSICLKRNVMKRLLEDPLLRKYEVS
ncbi:transferase family protein [Colletotrichum sojae]|uniref:Transferase family protein n=1 Tax=Colletotrichum sojae TaxID=2175907 RepID=A0A8H6IQT1_9PEZI|nr:transferase family protein [Colletotrichum sojae]